ncbi:MAG: DUF3102 domain-containing protein [Ruminiclostridium sp.]|nr:DUF3102 domain-containing protein [Ruminiclostridium sp.]
MDEMVKTERTVDTVTLEINTLHRQAQQMMLGYVIEIGKRLVEVKEMLPYGSWGTYLAERTPYSQSTANNFMKIFQEYGDENLSLFEQGTKSQTFGKLSYTQALALLALPANEREEFAQENNVEDMSSRQLQEAIRERNQAREEADRLKAAAKELEEAKAQLAHAEKSRAKMEEDMGLLNERLAGLNQEVEALRGRPVEVAVMETDPKELEEARKAGVEEARAEAEAQLEKSKKALDKVKEKEQAALEQVEALQKALEQANQKAEEAKKVSAAAGSKELATFQVLFDQAQGLVNKMGVIRRDLEARGEGDTAGKLAKAMEALAEAILAKAK